MKSEPYRQLCSLTTQSIGYVNVADILSGMTADQLRKLSDEIAKRLSKKDSK